MISDIRTIMWKESKERSGQNPGLRGKISSLAFPVISLGILAIYPPLAVGPGWVASPFTLFGTFFTTLMVTIMTIADSIAGERERDTLETLLASRMPNQAILFGKLASTISLALSFTFFLHLVSLITLNLAHWKGSILFYTPTILLLNLSMSILLGILAGSIGVFFSLRAKSVQQAQQHLMVALLSPFTLLFASMFIITTVAGERLRGQVERFFIEVVMKANFNQVMTVVVGILILVDVVLIFATLRRFQRERLIL